MNFIEIYFLIGVVVSTVIFMGWHQSPDQNERIDALYSSASFSLGASLFVFSTVMNVLTWPWLIYKYISLLIFRWNIRQIHRRVLKANMVIRICCDEDLSPEQIKDIEKRIRELEPVIQKIRDGAK